MAPETSDVLRAIRARTPARILVGRAGPSYRTSTQLSLRQDHAFALDAVHAEVDLRRDLGRQLSDEARTFIRTYCPAGADLQIAIGDGLSAAAVAAQVPALLPLLDDLTRRRGWSFGRPFFVRHCRVGVLNDIGDVLAPAVVVLLIGERPGLATAESLSAYMAYRPHAGDTDARRNLISNIHARGVPLAEAAARVLALADQMRRVQASGVTVKEERGALSRSERRPSALPERGGDA